jgi:Cu(I)/Ag(I) efflux system membrane fusion protein
VVVALGDGEFRVHEVLTGLESGAFVEILAGIEAGDEVVTSAQFLIDSEASLAGSIKRLESPVAAAENRPAPPVYASGRVEAVDRRERRVRISHGPIEVLGWPSMTMVFDVRPGVDLGATEVGQDIRFELEQEHAGEYVLARVFSDESSAGDMASVPPDRPPARAEASDGPMTGAPHRIMAGAVVRGVMSGEQKLRLEHEPIPELDWPTMTMNFRVGDGVAIDHLEPGQSIHFAMVKEGDAWVIDQVHVIDASPAEEHHDHD